MSFPAIGYSRCHLALAPKPGLTGSSPKWQLPTSLLFFSFISDLATTMSQATADTVHTEILPCVQDHVQDHPTAAGPGDDACPLPAAPLAPAGHEMLSHALPSPWFIGHIGSCQSPAVD